MVPVELHRKKREFSHQQGPLCCALPALPTLPKLPHFKELDGCLCAVAHMHSALSNALHNLKLSLLSNLREAAAQHPHLLRVLPPQILASCSPQIRDHSKRRHELAAYNFAAVLPGDSVAVGVVSNGILNFLNIYNTLLVVRLILTWFPEPPQVIVNPLSTICDPYLNIFRGIIPPLGGSIDLSPILAFLVLNVFTNSAAALPAELPPPAAAGGAEASQSGTNQLFSVAGPTQAQEAWLRRLAGSLGARKATV